MPRRVFDKICFPEMAEEDMVIKFNCYTNAYEKAGRPKGEKRFKFILKYLRKD